MNEADKEIQELNKALRLAKARRDKSKVSYPLDIHIRLDVGMLDKITRYAREHSILNLSKAIRQVLSKGIEALGL